MEKCPFQIVFTRGTIYSNNKPKIKFSCVLKFFIRFYGLKNVILLDLKCPHFTKLFDNDTADNVVYENIFLDIS